MGDIFGGGQSNQSSYELRGTVDSVDRNSRSVYLTNVSGHNSSMLSSGGANGSVRVYYDDRTPVSYNGQSYRVEDLERGDQVAVRVDESGNQLLAESMTVTHNVSAGGSSQYPAYGSTVRGTVRYIDTSRRTIEVDRGNGSLMYVEYDTNTPVSYNNQSYRVADLERGDEIEIRVQDLGSNRFRAQDIMVTRNVSSSGGISGGSTNTNLSTVRGTVRYVDTSRRTIELESVSWMSNFKSGTGTNSSRVIVSYDSNTSVDVSGRMHPVSGLERGDVIEVQTANPNSATPFASRIYLVRDVNTR